MKKTTVLKERRTLLEILRQYSVIVTAVVMVMIALISTKGTYLTANNLLNVGERAAAIGIVALGQMLVILTGGIDLSVSGIIAVGFSITTLFSDKITTIPIPIVILLMILVTTGCGSINGLLVSRTKIPPFMITLGTYLVFQSVALVLSGAANLSFENQVDWMYTNLGLTGFVGRIFPTVLWLVISGIIIFILAFTKFGKNIYAIGASELASKMSGINNNKIKFSVYALSGLLCGLAALTIEFRLRNCNPASSVTYQIDSIAAVIVGGASLTGGEGNVYGTFIGAFIMASLVNLMNLVGLDVYSQNIVKGIVLIGFILVTRVLANSKKKV
ncbi:MAG: ABC transporter permease [Clostridia bacterium]|nr:ABC transporter permease [Clostridia bacterium]